MPKRPRRSRRSTPKATNDKATLPKWIRWLISGFLDALRQKLVGFVFLLLLSAVPHDYNDYSWSSSPEAIKVQYYQI